MRQSKLKSTPNPSRLTQPPPLPPPLPKNQQPSMMDSAQDTDQKAKWILLVAIAAGIILALFFIPLILGRLNSGGSSTDGEAPSAHAKSAAALSIDNDVTKAPTASPSFPNEPVQEPPFTSSEKMVDEESAEQKSASMLLTYKPKPASKGSIASRASGNKRGSEIEATGGRNPFLGEGTPVKSTVFVVDVSGSMQNATRLPRVLASMKRAIELMTTSQQFAVVLFDTQTYAFPNQPALLDATSKNKDAAFLWLDSTYGGGGTNPIPGMSIALGLNPERIVLLSDGEFDPYCVAFIQTENHAQGKPARIDCIGLDEEVETLKEIAKQNKGIYYQAF